MKDSCHRLSLFVEDWPSQFAVSIDFVAFQSIDLEVVHIPP